MSEQNQRHSVTSIKRSFRIAASPFNPVKFEVGIILLIGALLLLVQERLISDTTLQLLSLLAYGLAGMVWTLFRTRRIMDKLASSPEQHSENGSQQE